MHLLIVEDDLDLGRALVGALCHHGFTSEWVRTAKNAGTRACGSDAPRFSCVVLDLGLPDGDGVGLIKSWRGRHIDLPIIVLTARDSLASRIEGLDLGADDYVIKPVEPEELAARIHAVVRRSARQASTVWNVGNLHIDTRRNEIRQDEEVISLSPKEYLLVVELARMSGQVVPRHRVAQALNPLGEPVEFSTLDWHIHNLRRKLGIDRIHTVRGVGYRLDET